MYHKYWLFHHKYKGGFATTGVSYNDLGTWGGANNRFTVVGNPLEVYTEGVFEKNSP